MAAGENFCEFSRLSSFLCNNHHQCFHLIVERLDLLTQVQKIPFRIINPVNKKDYQAYMFRYSSSNDFSTVDTLREGIKSQFGSELIPNTNFEVGYLIGHQKLWIRCDDDLIDVWAYIKKGRGSFWCVGANKSKKRKRHVENE